MAATSSPREKYAYIAKLADEAESYDEMVEFMEKVCTASDSEDEDLTVEERNLLSVAYKSVIGRKRASLRVITSMEKMEDCLGNDDQVACIREFRSMMESHLCNFCDHVLNLLDSRLIPSASSADSKVFYLMMKGDYYRYLAEFKTSDQHKESVKSTLNAYKSAQDIANQELAPTHHIRLSLALNFSVFYYEILNSPEHACKLANKAFDEAISELDTLEGESYKVSTMIMQLLRDNLNLWTSKTQDL